MLSVTLQGKPVLRPVLYHHPLLRRPCFGPTAASSKETRAKENNFDSKAGAQRRVAVCSTSSDRLFNFGIEDPATEALNGQQHCPKLDSFHCSLLPDFLKQSNR
jgi:hypothetical protein